MPTPATVKPPTKAAYEIAKRVYGGELGQTVGAKLLASDYGFNVNSARDLIMVFRHLLRGLMFQRGLSAPDMDYFLTRIRSDFGPIALSTAVQALWLHLRYYEGIRGVTMKKLRAVAASHQERATILGPLEELESAFRDAVNHSLAGSAAARKKRIQDARRVPARKPVVLFVFDRNPDVVAEVLDRAKGTCEGCGARAPFLRRKDNSPYLEVHHRIQLSDGGDDTVENAIALCPNCHRKQHYGVKEATEG